MRASVDAIGLSTVCFGSLTVDPFLNLKNLQIGAIPPVSESLPAMLLHTDTSSLLLPDSE